MFLFSKKNKKGQIIYPKKGKIPFSTKKRGEEDKKIFSNFKSKENKPNLAKLP